VISSDWPAINPPDPARRPRVLVVDDSGFARKMITLLLESSGFEVVGHARDGVEALEQVAELHPDVMTLDINMPRLDGFETLQRLRETNPMPVVMVTTLPLTSMEPLGGVDRLGDVSFVTKTFTENSMDLSVFQTELVTALRAALRPQHV
jgi:two-component system chemotaxis response regulator CheB